LAMGCGKSLLLVRAKRLMGATFADLLPWRKLAEVLAATAACAAVTLEVKSHLPAAPLPLLVMAVGAYLFVYLGILAVRGALDGRSGGSGGKPLAAITGDDGYSNLYDYAYPVLRRLSLPATVFVITEFLLSGRARWWDRMRAMVAATRIPAVRVPLAGTPRWLPLGTVAEKQAALRAVARELQSLPPGRREALLARLAADLRVEGLAPATPRSL